jgi:hypothetical protein
MKITMNRPISACFVVLAAFLSGVSVPAAGAPAAGDTYLYRVVNAYSQEVLGQVQYQVSAVDAGRVTVLVSPDSAAAGAERTEAYTSDGNWLRATIESHGVPVEYEFAAPYPAFVFPLEPGKTWSLRVGASVPAMAVRRSVRVDGRVSGTERIRVPAGEFDTIRVRRLVYPGDEGHNHASETRITETDWYAPALGRAVRTERKSEWIDTSQCSQHGGCDFRGSWEVIELVTAPAKR